VLAVGEWLGASGIRNWALTRQEALTALDALERDGIGILGGETYDVAPNKTFPNKDGWHCDRRTGESDQQFLERSLAVARNYVRTYRVGEEDRIRFGIVPTK
jgi:hypothetical protein